MPTSSFVQAYQAWVEPRSESPAMFHTFAALAMCAAALGNRVWYEAAYGPIFPHFWLGMIGPSAVQKSSAIRQPQRLLENVLTEDAMYEEAFTMEAFLVRLQQQPVGVLIWSELGRAMEAFSRDYSAGVMSLMIKMWDARSDITGNTISRGLIRITRPAMTVIAAGKTDWFERYIKRPGDGWMGRWLFCYEQTPGPFKRLYSQRNGWRSEAEADRIVRESLVDHLRRLTEYEGGEILGGEGGDLIDDWREKNAAWSDSEDQAQFHSRAAENIVKLAIAIQAAGGVSQLMELHPKAVEQAIGLWEYSYKCGRDIVDTIVQNKQAREDADELARFDRTLSELGGTASQRALLRKLRVPSGKFFVFAKTLEEQGQWESSTMTPELGGTKSTIWTRK